jgi:hypothetical protein
MATSLAGTCDGLIVAQVAWSPAVARGPAFSLELAEKGRISGQKGRFSGVSVYHSDNGMILASLQHLIDSNSFPDRFRRGFAP